MKEVTPLRPVSGPDLEALRYSSLENRILTQAPSVLLQPPAWAVLTSSCPALLPSSLSSTSSSSPLLSTSSSLLSSENAQLKRDPLAVSSLCSVHPLSSLVQTAAPPAAPEAHRHLGEKNDGVKLEEDESCFSDELKSYTEKLHEVRFIIVS